MRELGRLAGLCPCLRQAREQRARFIERGVRAQGNLCHPIKSCLEQRTLTRCQLHAGFEVAEFVGGVCHALGKAPGIAAAQRYRGDLLNALQLGADGRHALTQGALVLGLHLRGLIGGSGGRLVSRGHGGHLLPHLRHCRPERGFGLRQIAGADAHRLHDLAGFGECPALVAELGAQSRRGADGQVVLFAQRRLCVLRLARCLGGASQRLLLGSDLCGRCADAFLQARHSGLVFIGTPGSPLGFFAHCLQGVALALQAGAGLF